MKQLDKDPDAVLDYSWDWSDWLDDISDSTATAQVLVPAGLTKGSEVIAGPIVTVWLSGGVPGLTHVVTCRLTTVDGRTEDRSISLYVVDR